MGWLLGPGLPNPKPFVYSALVQDHISAYNDNINEILTIQRNNKENIKFILNSSNGRYDQGLHNLPCRA